MANGIRVRANFVGGVVDDNPLTIGATTITSSTLNQLPPIGASEHAVIVLDPGGVGGAPEIIFVTAHTNGATTATISRAEEGTTARQHNQNTTWVHSGIASDFTLSKDIIHGLNVNSGNLSDEFNDSSLDVAWTRIDRAGNSGNVAWAEGGDVLSVTSTATDNNAELHCLVKSLGGASFPLTIETATRHFAPYALNYQMLGLVLSDGTSFGSGSQIISMPYTYTGIADMQLSFRSHAGFNTGVTTFGGADYMMWGSVLYQRIVWSAANSFEAFYSPNGVQWLRIPDTVNNYTFAPTHAGLLISHWGFGRRSIGTFEYFRIS